MPVTCGIAINAPILRPWLEETDSLGRGVHGRTYVVIATSYRVNSRFFAKNEPKVTDRERFFPLETYGYNWPRLEPRNHPDRPNGSLETRPFTPTVLAIVTPRYSAADSRSPSVHQRDSQILPNLMSWASWPFSREIPS